MKRLLLASLLCAAVLMAAQASAPMPTNPTPAELGDYVTRQFGGDIKIAPFTPRGVGGQVLKGAPPILLLTGDLDGDGTEDAVIVAKTGANPLLAQEQFGYKVIDPYDSYYGFGDTRITRQFTMQDSDRENALLIVHNWRAATPKNKLVIINLPFDRLALQQVTLKKKPRTVIMTEEAGLMQSTVYWDGKRYRYEPGTGESE